jgi:hypothetical protein
MAQYWGKQPSSRPIVYQFLTYAGNATSVPSTAFSPFTTQVRVCSEVQGWLQFDGSAVSATVTSSSMKIPPNVPEYFTVASGGFCAFNSTSTATGVCSVTEMA